LALQAIDDTEARVVLADSVIETGFQSDAAEELCSIRPVQVDGVVYRFRPEAMAGFALGCRAIAAVLLFGDWPTAWPLAAACHEIEWPPSEQWERWGSPVRFALRLDGGRRMLDCAVVGARTRAWVELNPEVFALLDGAAAGVIVGRVGELDLPAIATMLESTLRRRWPDEEFVVQASPRQG